jgi:hypothetical protein
MMSIWLFATPMNGLSKSSSFSPVALSKLLCGVFSHPFLIVSLLIYRPNEKILTNYTKGRYNFATKTKKEQKMRNKYTPQNTYTKAVSSLLLLCLSTLL